MKLSVVFIAAMAISLFVLAPFVNAQSIKGNGKVEEDVRSVGEFTGVKVGGAFDVFIKKGSKHSVIVEADENILPAVVTEVSGNTLRIKTNKNIRTTKELNVYIVMEDLDHLEVSGAADLEVESVFTMDNMEIAASGASDVQLEIDADQLEASVSGSSDLRIQGTADRIHLSVSGSADFKGGDLRGHRGDISVSGSGDAHVHLTKEIKASVSGSGDVYCAGSPDQTDIHTSGSGDVHIN